MTFIFNYNQSYVMKKIAICIFGIILSYNTNAQNKCELDSSLESTKDLKYIGMPVGGICAGQVYLGGDGQLWYWDIFNISRISPGNDAGQRYYLDPLTQKEEFANGFGIAIKQGDKRYNRRLNSSGFDDITFNGRYPIGDVSFKDSSLPVSVNLTAYSPFIPNDDINSGLPVTILEYSVTNNENEAVSIDLTGWLQNMSCFQSATKTAGEHINKVVKTPDYTQVVFESKGTETDQFADWGNMSLTLLGEGKASAKSLKTKGIRIYATQEDSQTASASLGIPLVGGITGSATLNKGETKTFTFLISWYYPNIHLWDTAPKWKNKERLRHFYSSQFENSQSVATHVINNKQLLETTKLWVENWYDSSLPRWFLDRTFLNVSTLATTAAVRFDDLDDTPENEGRFYTLEGVYLGDGTCTHVFHYEQAMGRVFPNLTRQLREQVDLGLAFKDGIITYRGEFSHVGKHDGRGHAVDGHAGTIMRIYREHLMSADNEFLKRNWPRIKQAMQVLIDQDKDEKGETDGILEGVQYNTLDRMWYGKIAWISGLYAAALNASAEMAKEVKDSRFEKTCRKIAAQSYENISTELFNGEYFIQKLDPKHPEAPNTNNGCHIDQMLGQYWVSQMGLPNIVPEEKLNKALGAILKYNYVTNYDEYLKHAEIPIKRWYADGNEEGVVMCSFPHGGADKAPGVVNNEWEKLIVGYFSEMWTGQEHALAATMISQGMIKEAMKVEEAIHQRYSSKKRNPYNEIEYGNHYTRAMSGYAPFISASGFIHHGPKGVIKFNPKINSEKFKSAFIASEGWGNYEQKRDVGKENFTLTLLDGKLRLNQIGVNTLTQVDREQISTLLNGKPIEAKYSILKQQLNVNIEETILNKGDKIEIVVSSL